MSQCGVVSEKSSVFRSVFEHLIGVRLKMIETHSLLVSSGIMVIFFVYFRHRVVFWLVAGMAGPHWRARKWGLINYCQMLNGTLALVDTFSIHQYPNFHVIVSGWGQSYSKVNAESDATLSGLIHLPSIIKQVNKSSPDGF